MSDQHSREISVFLAAIETKGTEELRAYLDNACGDDHQLRSDVEALLVAHLKDNSFLEHPAPAIAQTIELNQHALDAGMAATFGPDAAIVIGNASHSVLKSLSKRLATTPTIMLRENGEAEGKVVQLGSKEFSNKQTDSRYQLHGEIARGGMGAIIKGRDTDLGRDLAIKVLLDEHKDKPEMLQRFVEEAQIGGQLQHPGIVPVYELGLFHDERPFFSMKLVKGETLAELLAIRKNPQDNLPKLLGIFEQVCQAMAYAHSKGVVHRDLKPANIMIGSFGEVQVMDWGLSKVLSKGGVADERKSLDKHRNVSVIQTRRSVGSDVPGDGGSNTQLGSVMGTPAYMPPEQALGEIDRLDERADVFGLGAILAEILSGKPPYVADDATQVFRMASRGKLDECFTRLDTSGVDGELIELAKNALSAEVDDRPRNAGQLSAGITKQLEGVQTRLKQAEFAKVEAETRSEEQRRRKKLYMAIAGMLLLLAVSGAVASALYKQKALTQTELAQSKSDLVVETQRNLEEQVKNLEAAEKATQRADVMLLAAEAQRIEDDLPIQSVLLAMEAVRMSDDKKLWPLPIAHATLLKSLANLGGAPLLHQEGGIRGPTVSPNDRMVTHTFDGGNIGNNKGASFRVWNLNDDDPAASSLTLNLGDGEKARSQAISANGRRIVTGSNGSAHVWEVSAAGDQVGPPTDLPGQVRQVAVAISPDGQWIFTATCGVKIDDQRAGKDMLWKLDEAVQPKLVAEFEQISDALRKQIEFSPNNQWLVVVARDKEDNTGRTFLLDLRSKDVAGSIRSLENAEATSSAAFANDGRWLVTGGSDGVRLFDLTANDMPASVRELTRKKVGNVEISKDGRWLIAAGVESLLFDLSASEPASSAIILAGGGFESFRHTVAISPDNRWLATGAKLPILWDLNSIDSLKLPILTDDAGNSARLWDANAPGSLGKTFVLRGQDDMVSGMHFTSDSNRLLVGSWDGSIRTWNVASENPESSFVLRGHTAPIFVVAISPDLRWAVTGSEDRTVRLWDLTSDTPSASSIILPHQEFVRTVAISPDSRWLITASGHLNYQPKGRDSDARVWDLTAKDPSKSMQILSGHEEMVTHVKISPDSRRAVTLSYDRTARVWKLDGNIASQEPLVLSGHELIMSSVAFSPDSNSLVTGCFDGLVRYWDLTAPNLILPKVLLSQENWVLGLSMETNRVRAFMAGGKDRHGVWDLEPKSLTSALLREVQVGWTFPFATEIQGQWMGLPHPGNNADVWDLSDNTSTTPFVVHAHDSDVFATAFSPDGSLFASCGDDRTARVSHLSAENPLNTTLVLRGHQSGVNSVAISADNRWVLTGSNDHTARLWDLDIKKLMDRAQKLVGRELTDAERERYLIPERK